MDDEERFKILHHAWDEFEKAMWNEFESSKFGKFMFWLADKLAAWLERFGK